MNDLNIYTYILYVCLDSFTIQNNVELETKNELGRITGWLNYYTINFLLFCFWSSSIAHRSAASLLDRGLNVLKNYFHACLTENTACFFSRFLVLIYHEICERCYILYAFCGVIVVWFSYVCMHECCKGSLYRRRRRRRRRYYRRRYCRRLKKTVAAAAAAAA